jgi:hypothetical protein
MPPSFVEHKPDGEMQAETRQSELQAVIQSSSVFTLGVAKEIARFLSSVIDHMERRS